MTAPQVTPQLDCIPLAPPGDGRNKFCKWEHLALTSDQDSASKLFSDPKPEGKSHNSNKLTNQRLNSPPGAQNPVRSFHRTLAPQFPPETTNAYTHTRHAFYVTNQPALRLNRHLCLCESTSVRKRTRNTIQACKNIEWKDSRTWNSWSLKAGLHKHAGGILCCLSESEILQNIPPHCAQLTTFTGSPKTDIIITDYSNCMRVNTSSWTSCAQIFKTKIHSIHFVYGLIGYIKSVPCTHTRARRKRKQTL